MTDHRKDPPSSPSVAASHAAASAASNAGGGAATIPKCDITIDGERFDITNLIGALPPEDAGGKPSATGTARTNNNNRRSSLAKLSKQSSHHYPRGLNLYGAFGASSHGDDDDDHSFTWDNIMNKAAAARAAAHAPYASATTRDDDDDLPPRRTSRMSSMSSLSMSCHSQEGRDHGVDHYIYHDHLPPGLTQLDESHSSFSEHNHYVVEQAMAAQSILKEEEDCQEIEISPGVFLPFRGSDETWDAIKNGRAVSVYCFDCNIELIAAQDCQHAICPQCHTVNPISMKDHKSTGSSRSLGPASFAGDDDDDDDDDYDDERDQLGLTSHHSVHFGVLMGFKKEWCGDYYDRVKHSKW